MLIEGEVHLDYDIMNEKLPSYYKISWDKDSASFIISVCGKLIPELQDLLTPNTPIIQMLQKDEGLKVDTFLPPTNDSWGFGPIFELANQDNGYITWRAKVPCLEQGKGKKLTYLNRPAINLAVSLNVLFMFLNLKQNLIETTQSEPQLVSCSLSTEMRTTWGFSIWSTLSKELADWLRTLGEERYIKDISDTMMQTWLTMHPSDSIKRNYLKHDFIALYRQPCWINLSVPGNACGLDPNDYYDQDRGYKLSPHNTDSPCQQLSLLAGIAAICDFWRQAHPAP